MKLQYNYPIDVMKRLGEGHLNSVSGNVNPNEASKYLSLSMVYVEKV